MPTGDGRQGTGDLLIAIFDFRFAIADWRSPIAWNSCSFAILMPPQQDREVVSNGGFRIES
jgi:hypothetical protein